MKGLRIILGAASARELRALVLVRARANGGPPSLLLTDTSTGQAQVPRCVRLPSGAGALRAALDARDVQAYVVHATGLSPSASYRLEARVGTELRQAHVRTLPLSLPADGITVAVASCYFDGYHRDAELRASLSQPRGGQAPLFHLWVGDNLYLDVPADPSSHRPYAHTVDRYLRYFLDSGYADVRGLASTFTTYDDHEFWNNYPELVPWLSRTWPKSRAEYEAAALDCLALFQASLNPSSSGFFSFRIDPLEFFVLDTRTFRQPRKSGRSRMAKHEALQALEAWTDALDGPGVLVLGQPLWISEGNGFDYNPPAFAEQYAAIWACLRRAPYDMLVVSGDVHHSRVLKLSFRSAPNRHVFEFVSSPACHIPKALRARQDEGDLSSIPEAVRNAGQALSASYFFGTSAPNSFGLLRFTPMPGRQVRVGASFVDYLARDPYPPAKPIPRLPRATRAAPSHCHEPNLCVLRMR